MFDFGEGFGAALADGRIAFIFADVRGIVPAALAFRAFCGNDAYSQSRNCFGAERIRVQHARVQWTRRIGWNSYLGNDQERRTA